MGAGASVALLPVNAISGIADSQFVVGMSRGRAWVVVLGVLLTGIVALNVLGLSLSAAGSDTSKKVDELQQQNSVLRARIANRLSTERISQAASALGLAVPAPDAVSYLESRSGDAERAAQRLAAGEIAAGAPAIAPVTPVEPAVTDPATIDPAATDPTAVTPTTSTVDPAATTAPTTPSPVDPALAPTATVP
ncbi:MAG TPA: hypothetical protein VFH44_07175 [Solirubrobacterales bacterium]|nr:hypothetical protein [Solirubrobacterales bacterium]